MKLKRIYTHCTFIVLTVLRRSVKQVGGALFYVIASGLQSSFGRSVAVVASRRQHGIQFDWPKIKTSDLPLSRRTRYHLSTWPVNQVFLHKESFCHRCLQKSSARFHCQHFDQPTKKMVAFQKRLL